MIPFPSPPHIPYYGRVPPPYEPRYCTCTSDDVASDEFGMCLDCLRLIDPDPKETL